MRIPGGDFYVNLKLTFLARLEEQIICASPSELCEWEKIGLLRTISDLKLAMVDVDHRNEQEKELAS